VNIGFASALKPDPVPNDQRYDAIGPVERLVNDTVSGAAPTCGLAAKTAFNSCVVPVRVRVGVRVGVLVRDTVAVPSVPVSDGERVGEAVPDPVGEGVLVAVTTVELGEAVHVGV
jgi:hypothetical protein